MNRSRQVSGQPWIIAADSCWLAALSLLVVLCWCAGWGRWTAYAWQTPIAYQVDALIEMTNVKAFATGEVAPIAPKTVSSLGAPFAAEWADYPITEEGIYVWIALLQKIFGVFLGSNLGVLSAHLLAAVCFYCVSRVLSVDRIWAATGGLLFGMSQFAFVRGLFHLTVAFYWHVPLGLLVVWWCIRRPALISDRKKLLVCLATPVLFGVQNVYYSGLFCQFFGLAAFLCWMRGYERRRVLFPVLLASILVGVVLLMNADTLYYWITHGRNPSGVVRDYADLERYSLKPIELFLPAAHLITPISDWVWRVYVTQTSLRGEIGPPYLGVVGIIAAGMLGWSTLRAIVLGSPRSVPWQAGFVLWVFLFSVMAGINGALGLFGWRFFRSSNRYSIVILALVLLFLAERLSALTRGWSRSTVWLIAGLICVVGVFDQTPRNSPRRTVPNVRPQLESDARVVATLEAKLPPRAMIFQLPVIDFPEGPQIGQMDPYAHLRPYLHARTLRFSFGSVKGRPREKWQREIGHRGQPGFFQDLERYGFSAVMINKRAYQDSGAALVSALAASGRNNVLAESPDLVTIALVPAQEPRLPPVFETGWLDLESDAARDWRWSVGDAEIVLSNPFPQPKTERVSFRLGTFQPRQAEIYLNSNRLHSAALTPEDDPAQVALSVTLQPGSNTLRFKTDRPGQSPNATDPRKLAFKLIDFTVED